MRIEGNDHIIKLNVIRNVVQESDDQGGLDMWGNPLYRGVVIRWNRWSDIRGGTHNGAAGIRLDDMISGVTVHGNIFEGCGSVIFGGARSTEEKKTLWTATSSLIAMRELVSAAGAENAGWNLFKDFSNRQANLHIQTAIRN